MWIFSRVRAGIPLSAGRATAGSPPFGLERPMIDPTPGPMASGDRPRLCPNGGPARIAELAEAACRVGFAFCEKMRTVNPSAPPVALRSNHRPEMADDLLEPAGNLA